MKLFLHFISFALLSQLFVGCSLVGINYKRETPKKADKYPSFTEKDHLQGNLSEIRKSFDVTFYDINIDMDVKKGTVKGTVGMHFSAVENVDTLQIDLYDNLKINSITSGNEALTYYRKYNAVFVVLKKTVAKGGKNNILIAYEGKPVRAKRPPWEGGFVWKKDKNGKPWLGVACEV